MEAAMVQLKTRVGLVIAFVGLILAALSVRPAPTFGQPQGGVTAFEGARVIVGDGRTIIENAVFLVNGPRITQVGRAGQVTIPTGATRVNLAGKTVMPAIIDTHTHLSQTREMLLNDLKRRAFYGVGAALSLGQDTTDVSFQMRAETRAGSIPGAARFFTAGRGITGPEPGRTTAPHWVTTAAEARQAVDEEAAKKVDLIKIWVDDRMGSVKKLTPEVYSAAIDEAHKHGLRTIAHIYTLEDAKGVLRAGIDAFAHSVRDKDIDDEFLQMIKAKPKIIVDPNLPDRGVRVDRSWLRDGIPAAEFQKLQAESKDDPKAAQFFGIQ